MKEKKKFWFMQHVTERWNSHPQDMAQAISASCFRKRFKSRRTNTARIIKDYSR